MGCTQPGPGVKVPPDEERIQRSWGEGGLGETLEGLMDERRPRGNHRKAPSVGPRPGSKIAAQD